MKKLFLGLIATVMFSTISYSQEKTTLESVVSQEEYQTMNDQEKNLIDFLDSGIAALKGLQLNKQDSKKYRATVTISAKGEISENSILIQEYEGELPSVQSCTICNFLAARTCIKRIISTLSNGTLVVTIERDGKCFKVSWPDV